MGPEEMGIRIEKTELRRRKPQLAVQNREFGSNENPSAELNQKPDTLIPRLILYSVFCFPDSESCNS
jgi:hypothetical protein